MISTWILRVLWFIAFVYFVSIVRTFYKDLIDRTKFSAECVAKKKWYVKGAYVITLKATHFLDLNGWREVKHNNHFMFKDSGILTLRSTDMDRQELILQINPEHPSTQDLLDLSYYEIVGLKYVGKPLKCAFKTQLCAYLLLDLGR